MICYILYKLWRMNNIIFIPEKKSILERNTLSQIFSSYRDLGVLVYTIITNISVSWKDFESYHECADMHTL